MLGWHLIDQMDKDQHESNMAVCKLTVLILEISDLSLHKQPSSMRYHLNKHTTDNEMISYIRKSKTIIAFH